jgi:arginase family enzyme
MLCRISERAPHATRELAEALVEEPRFIGSAEAPRTAGWEDDLREARGCLLEAGGQVDDALTAGGFPLLFAGDCGIALTTLATVRRHRPDARVLWLDAHGDFNTPATTGSGFLGGMCLAAACGRWDSGFGAGLDPRRVVMSDGRDLDPAEREELDRAGVPVVPPAGVADAVRGQRVFLHLDFDILDPSVMPAGVPAPGGLSADELRALMVDLADAVELIGVELTALETPEHAALLAEVVAPVLRS